MRLPAPLPLRSAETDSVWVIVPWSRPENCDHVIANFNRQRFPFKRLVVVCNGAALGSSGLMEQPRSGAALVLTSDAHQSIAKNTALAEIRKRGGGFTVVMDDDDWYGPDFLTEACGYARTYDVIGKDRHFVSVDGALWLCNRERAHRRSVTLSGGTIGCWAEDAPEYPLEAWGEDVAFCNIAERSGMSCYGTGLYHYLYRRDSQRRHTWRFSNSDLRDLESGSGALDLGQENLVIVTGQSITVEAKRLLPREDTVTLRPAPRGAHVAT